MTEVSSEIGIVGLGMIGGSVALGLREAGYRVVGWDLDDSRIRKAIKAGIIDDEMPPPGSKAWENNAVDVVFVATPIPFIAPTARQLLESNDSLVVTDVGSVKSSVVSQCSHARFCGGHPMAGSEVSGLDGSDKDKFCGATWVLTPDSTTSDETHMKVRALVEKLGAHVVTTQAHTHDEIVATVSHVPHLMAAALMHSASIADGEDARTLRLSATGFKDMTRIAAGDSQLWADILLGNSNSIAVALDKVIHQLAWLKDQIASGARDDLQAMLRLSAEARRALPARQGVPQQIAEIVIDIPDRPGALQTVFDSLGSANVNVEHLRIDHAVDGTHGLLFVSVDAAQSRVALDALEKSSMRAREAGRW